MANRTMAAKTLKLKRQRRLFPRYLSADYVPTGKPPNMLVMKELKERSRSLAFDDEYAEYLVLRSNMERMYPHPGREEVKKHIERISTVAPALMRVVLMNTNIRKVSMFFNETRDRFILFEDNPRLRFMRTSLVYMDRKRCISALKSDTVRWVHFSSVSPPPRSEPE